MRSSSFAVLAGALFCAVSAQALEIPLKQGAGGGGVTVGYVDMDAIFQEYPETKKAKTEYFKALQERRQVLAEREKELADLKEQLSVLRATLQEMQGGAAAKPPAPPAENVPTPPAAMDSSTAAVAGSTDTLSPPPYPETGMMRETQTQVSTASLSAVNESLLQREKDLAEKEADLEKERLAAAKELNDLEERRSLQIFGKLYNALVQLADEQGISLVVDKSAILYGQATMDLTERLRRRVRGMPEETFK